jgi:hypothetical protein
MVKTLIFVRLGLIPSVVPAIVDALARGCVQLMPSLEKEVFMPVVVMAVVVVCRPAL